MRRKIRVAQVGLGNWGKVRRQTLHSTGLFELVSGYDYNPVFLEEACAEHGATAAGSYEELLQTPGIEAVVISTGAKFHAEQALLAMDHGLHVFVEKPLCSTYSEVASLVAKQRETGVVVVTGHEDHRTSPYSLATRQLIDSGMVGKIVSFEMTTAHGGGFQITPDCWRGDRGRNPGGMLFQCGVHGLHELAYYFGEIEEVYCSMRYDLHEETQTADAAVCHLRFRSGLFGSLHTYHVTPYRHTLNIYGTKANLYRNDRSIEEGVIFEMQKIKLDCSVEPSEPVPIHAAGDEDGNLRSFHAAITEGAAPYPSLMDGARAVAVVLAAEESSNCGGPVRMDEFFPLLAQSPADPVHAIGKNARPGLHQSAVLS